MAHRDIPPFRVEHAKNEEKLTTDVIDVTCSPTTSGADSPTLRQLTAEEEKILWRKVDLRLMPILTIMYLFCFLDRGNIGNAKLQGLTSQLHLVGDEYNIALINVPAMGRRVSKAPASHIAYLNSLQSGLLLKRLRPSRWLPGITIAWGVVMTMMGIVKSYQQLVGVRICLGIAEAGLFPGIVYYLTLWYPRHMLQYRTGLFIGSASVAGLGAFSGLLAFGISFMSGAEGLEGWSWIFIIEGMATVVVGIIALFVLVDFPDTAKFLTEKERLFIIHKKKYDLSSVGEEERFALRHIWDAVTDWQVWMLSLVNMSIIGPLWGISLFLPSIIQGWAQASCVLGEFVINYTLCGAPSAIVLLLMAIWSDRIKMRSPFIVACLLMSLIGFAINITDAPTGAKYFGTFFCVVGHYAAFPGGITWLSNNMAGQYKRAVGIGLQGGMGMLAGAISSNVYRTQDAPRYILGHGIELMFVGLGLVSVPLTVLIYMGINTRRDRLRQELEGEEGGRKRVQYSVEELRTMGDRAPDFRYTL
ncbi:MFS general substrate transporter [Heliocybe sulcata]|uniref:MFS general substrate transporter n=1 Tax=Heliocybe sulcata TaxID=5364 RepID=A0A5C3N534_9AGAM|nr:MFS general substrate transporter [Heliocybe sulcata]